MCVFSLIVNHTLFQTTAAPDVKVKTEIVASPTSVVPAIVDFGEKNWVDLSEDQLNKDANLFTVHVNE
jgi:hypothetical protein